MRHARHILVYCAAVCILLTAGTVHAKPQTFTVTHTYVMGDEDSRNQARRYCLLEAKRKLLERVGAWVEGFTSARDFSLTGDALRSFTAGFVKARIEKETVAPSGDTFALTLTVKAELDPEAVRERLIRIAADPDARRWVAGYEAEDSSKGPRPVSLDQWPGSNGDQNDPGKPLSLAEPVQGVAPDAARAAAAALRKGDTLETVLQRMGRPQNVKEWTAPNGRHQCLDYNGVWAVLRGDRLACVRTRLQYKAEYGADCHCSGYGYAFLLR